MVYGTLLKVGQDNRRTVFIELNNAVCNRMLNGMCCGSKMVCLISLSTVILAQLVAIRYLHDVSVNID